MILKAATPSDIRSGSPYPAAGLRKFPHGVNGGRFDPVFGGSTLRDRHAGPQSMWLGSGFMRQFSPGDTLWSGTDDSKVFTGVDGGPGMGPVSDQGPSRHRRALGAPAPRIENGTPRSADLNAGPAALPRPFKIPAIAALPGRVPRGRRDRQEGREGAL